MPDSRWGFNLTVPELLYNRGELSNLSVARGTLTGDEIYKVRAHMIHTIVMLESMAPPSMGRVAKIAGGHHETLDGRGYPRGLTAEQLSIQAGLRDRGRIDADLFDLFLRSGGYITDAQRFLAADQIDPVDLDDLLQPRIQVP